MTLRDITEGLDWLKKNGKRELSDKEKNWLKERIDGAVTVKDLAGIAFDFFKKG